MSGWTNRQVGCVRLEHQSTSSTIKLIITEEDEYEQGKFRSIDRTTFMDYRTFEDLKAAIKLTED